MESPYQTPESSDFAPPVPGPPPRINHKLMWWSLLGPPAATAFSNFMIAALSLHGDYGIGFLLTVPVVLVVIIWGAIVFHRSIRGVYAGRSKVLLRFGYAFGQIIVCLVVALGSCALVMNVH